MQPHMCFIHLISELQVWFAWVPPSKETVVPKQQLCLALGQASQEQTSSRVFSHTSLLLSKHQMYIKYTWDIVYCMQLTFILPLAIIILS